VRIGRPLRPEFAAWRYGDQFGRRRKRALTYTATGLALLAGVTFLAPVAIGGTGLGGYYAWQIWEAVRERSMQAKLHTDDGRVIKLRKPDLKEVRLRPSDDGHGFRLSVLKGRKQEWFEGDQAERFASQIIPKVNEAGGKKQAVQAAVREIEHHGHPDRFLADLVTGDRFQSKKGVPGYINKMPEPTKLALEMALHEEAERRALEGELSRLEQAWEEAEEIAAIADGLILPTGAADFIERHRGEVDVEEEEERRAESDA
jgi:hypothetical protein